MKHFLSFVFIVALIAAFIYFSHVFTFENLKFLINGEKNFASISQEAFFKIKEISENKKTDKENAQKQNLINPSPSPLTLPSETKSSKSSQVSKINQKSEINQKNVSFPLPLKKNTPSPSPPNTSVQQKTKPAEPKKEEKTTLSPYYGKIKISSIKAETRTHPSLITLVTRSKKEEKINITGWKIKTRKGEITIPQAIEKYSPLVSPKDIYVQRGEKIYLIGASNPLGNNVNFKLNKCMGYLKNYHKFYPSFSSLCPKPSLKEISHLTPFCQEYILRLPRCKIPNYSNNFQIANNYQCTSFLKDNFSYSNCFKKYQKDEDFLKKYWYLYIKSNLVNKLHDTVSLYDQNGLLVDRYIY